MLIPLYLTDFLIAFMVTVFPILKTCSRPKVAKERIDRRKPPKPLQRSKNPIAKRGAVKVRDNPFKESLRKPFKGSQAGCIKAYRDEQLKIVTPAIEALETALRGLGIVYRREEPVIVDYRTFFLVDVWIPAARLGFEADGFAHKQQQVYDRDRDAIIQKLTGYRIARFFNGWFLKPGLRDRVLIELGRKR